MALINSALDVVRKSVQTLTRLNSPARTIISGKGVRSIIKGFYSCVNDIKPTLVEDYSQSVFSLKNNRRYRTVVKGLLGGEPEYKEIIPTNGRAFIKSFSSFNNRMQRFVLNNEKQERVAIKGLNNYTEEAIANQNNSKEIVNKIGFNPVQQTKTNILGPNERVVVQGFSRQNPNTILKALDVNAPINRIIGFAI